MPGWMSSTGTVRLDAFDFGSSIAVRCPSRRTRPALGTLTSPMLEIDTVPAQSHDLGAA